MVFDCGRGFLFIELASVHFGAVFFNLSLGIEPCLCFFVCLEVSGFSVGTDGSVQFCD